MSAWATVLLSGRAKEENFQGHDVYGNELHVGTSRLPKALRIVVAKQSSAILRWFFIQLVLTFGFVAIQKIFFQDSQQWQAPTYMLVASVPLVGGYILFYDVVTEELIIVPSFGIRSCTVTSLSYRSSDLQVHDPCTTSIIVREYMTMHRFIYGLAVIQSDYFHQKNGCQVNAINPLFRHTKPSLRIVKHIYNEMLDILDDCGNKAPFKSQSDEKHGSEISVS